ncbi:B-box type zinc finger protein with CCT domain [Striga asiatica]|uniref:B-box type zinc finger protein with CCT domain n=1 Tax=Striga asiatica TaxID=4170 RepID=A0A5A7Q3B3_STRAF|nr:B-box type zinc finger protein with CCT domain [Striga asiatica]
MLKRATMAGGDCGLTNGKKKEKIPASLMEGDERRDGRRKSSLQKIQRLQNIRRHWNATNDAMGEGGRQRRATTSVCSRLWVALGGGRECDGTVMARASITVREIGGREEDGGAAAWRNRSGCRGGTQQTSGCRRRRRGAGGSRGDGEMNGGVPELTTSDSRAAYGGRAVADVDPARCRRKSVRHRELVRTTVELVDEQEKSERWERRWPWKKMSTDRISTVVACGGGAKLEIGNVQQREWTWWRCADD